MPKSETNNDENTSLYNQNSQSPETIITLECSSKSPIEKSVNTTEQQSNTDNRLIRGGNNWEPLTPPQ